MCSSLSLQPVAVRAKPLTQVASYEVCRPVHDTVEREFHPVHMNWVVVTDMKGNRRLQISWRVNCPHANQVS